MLIFFFFLLCVGLSDGVLNSALPTFYLSTGDTGIVSSCNDHWPLKLPVNLGVQTNAGLSDVISCFFFKKIYLSNLFIFGCVRSSLLCAGFL